MIRNRYAAILVRLIEAGIVDHHERQNIEFYKIIRSDLLYHMNAKKQSEELLNNEELSSTLMLFAVVLGFGYTISAIVFAMELVWTCNQSV